MTRAKWPPFIKRAPRGKTGKTHPLSANLKENAPLVYAFTVDQLKRAHPRRDARFSALLKECQRESGSSQRPSARDLTAFVVERALDGAWEVWGMRRPYSQGDPDAFLRRFVRGNPGALQAYRKLLRQPKPWPQEHRGHWLEYFFGGRGQAAREFNLLTTDQPDWAVISLMEEGEPPPNPRP